jgi:cytochrome c oxidase subunit 4
MAEMAHAADMQHGHGHAEGGDHEGSHASVKFYVIVGIILSIVTAIEVAIFYVPALSRVLVPTLLVLSIGKFAGVVGYYMHLKFDNALFTFLFLVGLTLGVFEVVALMTLSHLNPRMMPPPRPAPLMLPTIALEPMSQEELDAITSGLPAEPTQADVAAGAELFPRAVCVGCHGQDGAGVVNMGPDLTDEIWLHSDGSYAMIVTTVLQGVPQAIELNNVMPPRGGAANLTEEQVLQLAAYVYSLSN